MSGYDDVSGDPEAALARLSELSSLGYAWRRLRAAGMPPDAIATWLVTPSAELGGEAPEDVVGVEAARLRALVDRVAAA